MKQKLQSNPVQRAGRFSLLPLVLLLLLAGCKTSKNAGTATEAPSCLSSKVELTVPTRDAILTVEGTMKLVGGERMQLSFLMPILRSEVARLEITPDDMLLVDRMGRRYVRATREELKAVLPRKADFAHLEKMLRDAAKPGAKKSLNGGELGIPALENGEIALYDFSENPFTLPPTELSERYQEVTLGELLEMLISIQQ